MELDKQIDEDHELKTHPPYFQAVWSGDKQFEIRVNDRNFKVGDTILLREYDPETNEYLGRAIKVWVTYLAQGVFGLPPDVCVMSINSCPKDTE